ncbi:MAG TPA: DUF2752 domain-containing protein [Ignavibacteria bacterium]|nr:DUF2752 domain-containing protein [Ignavibacteria bacterium]
MLSCKFKKDLSVALKSVWVIVSVFISAVLFLSVFYPEALLRSAPVCFSKALYNTECFMCGMTRAFNEISRGNFIQANELNSVSIIIYFLFVLNTAALIFYATGKILKTHNLYKKHQNTLLNKN